MRVENENALNFNGNLFINSSLSNKPKNCIKKIKSELQELIKDKDYNLYLMQNYSTNEINIAAGKLYPFYKGNKDGGQNNISIVSNYSKYVDAAKKTIDDYENRLRIKEQEQWESEKRQRTKNDIIDFIESLFYMPLFIVNDIIYSINPKWSKNFEKFIDKLI